MKSVELEGGNISDAGFSLIEVLVALLLVSIMAASLVDMSGQFRQIASSANRNFELAALEAAARHIARQVEQAEELPSNPIEPNSGLFLGSASEVQFVATVRLGSMEQGLRSITFALRDGVGLIQSNRMRRPNAPLDRGEASDILVLDGVQLLRFRYLGRDEATGSLTWTESWQITNKLPIAVSVALTKPDKAKRPMTSTAIAWLKP